MLTCALLQGLQTFMSIKEDFPWSGENTLFFFTIIPSYETGRICLSSPFLFLLNPVPVKVHRMQLLELCVWLSVKILFYMEIILFTGIYFK